MLFWPHSFYNKYMLYAGIWQFKCAINFKELKRSGLIFVCSNYLHKKYKYFVYSRFFRRARKIFWKPERTFFTFIQNFSFHKKEKEKDDFFSLLLVGRLLHSERCREECTAKPSSNKVSEVSCQTGHMNICSYSSCTALRWLPSVLGSSKLEFDSSSGS